MSEEIQKYEAQNFEVLEKVLLGDISKLSPKERMEYYVKLCDSLGLNPLTKPFEYLQLKGRLVLYATKSATEQLRKMYGISIIEKQIDDTFKDKGVYVVNVKVQDKEGRTDIGTGAVYIGSLQGDELCNAIMKAETKAKRRATLSICGLGFIDETETDTIANAQKITVEEAHNSYSISETLPQNIETKPDIIDNELIQTFKNDIDNIYTIDGAYAVFNDMKNKITDNKVKKVLWEYFTKSLEAIGIKIVGKDKFEFANEDRATVSQMVKSLEEYIEKRQLFVEWKNLLKTHYPSYNFEKRWQRVLVESFEYSVIYDLIKELEDNIKKNKEGK